MLIDINLPYFRAKHEELTCFGRGLNAENVELARVISAGPTRLNTPDLLHWTWAWGTGGGGWNKVKLQNLEISWNPPTKV